MKIGYTTGVFDMFHIGHLNILKNAKSQCDYLIVGISTDEVVLSYKKKRPIITFNERIEIVRSIKYVDEVIIEESWGQKPIDIKKHNIDVFVMGHDWKGKFDELKEHCEVVYLPRTKGISTTKIKNDLMVG